MIRELQVADFGGLDWLPRIRGPTFHWTLTQVQELSVNHRFWAWTDPGSGLLLAWVACVQQPQAWELTCLATHPDFQGHGYMRKLLTSLLAAQLQGAEIWLEVHESNAAARALYEHLDFVEVGRRPKYYSDGGTALLLTRKTA